MSDRAYYHAYDDRYRQVHERGLQWFEEDPSPIVMETLREFSISHQQKILEIGCGEGRDAIALLEQGYDLLATDISSEAIRFCQKRAPEYAARFQILDCVAGSLDGCFDYIYAVAVVHMLVLDGDRNGFYRFLRAHLRPEGIALICTMGDGVTVRQSDIRRAFDMEDRTHEQTGTPVQIARTSCRMVSFLTFEEELRQNGLRILKKGTTDTVPGFSRMMFAVVKRG